MTFPLSTTQSMIPHQNPECDKTEMYAPYSVAFPSKKVALERMRELSVKLCYRRAFNCCARWGYI